MRDSSDPRPLALLVTRNFPPLLGGMEKVNQHLLDALRPAWRTALCGPAGCAAFVRSTEVRASRVRPLPIFLAATLAWSVLLALRRQPQLVLAGSGLTAPIAWLAARLTGGQAVAYLHGLDVVAPSHLYQWLWLPFIRRCDMVLVNSSNTAKLAIGRGMVPGRVQILHPGTDLPVLDPQAGAAFRERFGFGGRPLLLSVGRLTQRKGLVEFVRDALPAVRAAHPDVLLVVIGEEASDALHSRSGSERERIVEAARWSGVEQNLHFLGRCDEPTLGAAYQAGDVHVFPVLALPGDVEGFGMVALEAAAHGLPTVAFDVGGVSDAVLHGATGELVEPGDYGALSVAVNRQLEQGRGSTTVNACRAFAAGKTWTVFAERLRQLLPAGGG